MGCKRSRSSALSPTLPEPAPPPNFPAATWHTHKPAVGPQILCQNPNLAMATPETGVLQQEKQHPKSSTLFSLPTSDAAKRSSPTGFGEFLQACRWCRKNIDEDSHVYMYGYLGAFCSPECRENQINLDRFLEMRFQNQVRLRREQNKLRKGDPI